MTKRRIMFLLLAGMAFSTACRIEQWSDARRFQDDFHHRYDFGPGGRLYVETFNGSVEIAGWDGETVEVSGTKYASTEQARDALKIDILQSPGSIRVRAVRPSGYLGDMGVRFVIKTPRRTVLERVQASNGPIRVNDIESDAKLQTSNGSITVDRLAGGLTARTSNGSIRMALPSWKGTDVGASTSNGAITLRLPDDTSAEIKARTSNGSVKCDFELAAGGARGLHRLDGVIGAGGPKLVLTTSNGGIRIERIR